MPPAIQETWTVTCACTKSTLTGRGTPIQVVLCHCPDCRKAGGNAYESIAFYKRSTQVDSVQGPVRIMPASEFKYQVPRYLCKECNSPLLADHSSVNHFCKESQDSGMYDLAMVPTRFMLCEPSEQGNMAEYHIHYDEKTCSDEEFANDGLPKYDGHPAGEHERRLSAGILGLDDLLD